MLIYSIILLIASLLVFVWSKSKLSDSKTIPYYDASHLIIRDTLRIITNVSFSMLLISIVMLIAVIWTEYQK